MLRLVSDTAAIRCSWSQCMRETRLSDGSDKGDWPWRDEAGQDRVGAVGKFVFNIEFHAR